jgi:hypothetical protein
MRIVPQSWSTGDTEYRDRNEPRDHGHKEAGDGIAQDWAEIEAITECVVLFIEAAEMQADRRRTAG